ncbi:MAG: trimethylamine methyltransferase family protein [Chloroflexota bacterium]
MARPRKRQRRERAQPTIPWLNLPFRQLTSPVAPMEWASPETIEKIHDASMRILEEVGMAFMDAEALSLWEKAGAKVDHANEHVWIDRGLLLELVAKAPSTFTWHARNPAYNLTMGGNHINFAPNSGMPYVSDLKGGRRTGTLVDYENFVKLAHTVPFFHIVGGPLVEPQDIRASLRHLYRTRVMVTTTDRVIRSVSHGRVIPEDIVQMLKLVYGDPLPGAVTGAIINVTSPLRLDDRMIGGIAGLARHNQVVIITPFIMAGATSPITMASALAQQNAEALGGIALTQLINPGTPTIYGSFAQNVDMRSGSPAFGGPEGAWGMMVGGQMARRYGLPYRASGSLTNSQSVDAQAAYETQWTMWPTVLAHANMVLHSVGWLEAGLVASYEKFVIDAETLGMFHHLLNDFAVTEESLAVDSIGEVGVGGHHFGSDLTQANYKTAFYEPALTSREGFEQWVANGKKDALQRAHDLWQQLLQAYERPPLDPAILDALNDFIARRERELEGVDLYA